ncbi:MAG: hypothetical protein IJR92_00645 [Alphaproteobacteria bacterium]|nr:hypothetical protein [Alphaproteobacteria bacterium]
MATFGYFRTKSSLDNLRANGKKLGRPFSAKSRNLKLSKNIKKIQKMLNNNTPKVEIARIFNVQTATLRRFMHRTNLY